jgi:hypothetical protein
MKQKEKEMVSLQQMKEALARKTGSKFPVKITTINGESMVRYIRGFADADNNILLMSDNAHTLALRILEVKDICRMQFAHEHSEGEWKTLTAKWVGKQAEDCNCL